MCLHHWRLLLISIADHEGRMKMHYFCTQSVQSQWIMSNVSASSPAVLYEVMCSLTSMGSLLRQKLSRDCRIWFHKGLKSTAFRAIEWNQDGSTSGLPICYAFLLPPWFMALLLWCVFLCPHSSVCFSSPTPLRPWSGWVGQVCYWTTSLWVALAVNKCGHELLGPQWGARAYWLLFE